MREIETPDGTARIHPVPLDEPRAMLLLGHSAGGGVDDPALRAAVRGAADAQVASTLVELPYRVAGRRPSAPADADAAWLAVAARVAEPGLALVSGGRSYGGRIACRTAETTASVGVLCIAFPLVPPYGSNRQSRLSELDAVGVPTLVVQGDRDPYGCPPEAAGRAVVVLRGDHSLRASLPGLAVTVTQWLDALLATEGPDLAL